MGIESLTIAEQVTQIERMLESLMDRVLDYDPSVAIDMAVAEKWIAELEEYEGVTDRKLREYIGQLDGLRTLYLNENK
jgi:hypothetical protein